MQSPAVHHHKAINCILRYIKKSIAHVYSYLATPIFNQSLSVTLIGSHALLHNDLLLKIAYILDHHWFHGKPKKYNIVGLFIRSQISDSCFHVKYNGLHFFNVIFKSTSNIVQCSTIIKQHTTLFRTLSSTSVRKTLR